MDQTTATTAPITKPPSASAGWCRKSMILDNMMIHAIVCCTWPPHPSHLPHHSLALSLPRMAPLAFPSSPLQPYGRVSDVIIASFHPS